MENRNVFLGVLILFVAAVLLTFKSGVSFADTGNITVTVNVSNITEITVTPTNLSWFGVTPGTTGGIRTVSVQNTGASGITNMYAYVTTIENETVRPYSSQDSASYSAGGTLVFHNESLGIGTGNYSFAGRLEWNWTETIANTDRTSQAPSGTPSARAEGFIRNGSKQFYWSAYNGTFVGLDAIDNNNTCNNTNAQIAIDDDEDNGTVQTRRANTTGIIRDGSDQTYAYFHIERETNPFRGYCIALNRSCDKMFIYKYDRRAGVNYPNIINATNCIYASYIQSGTLAPTEIERVSADVWVPKGVPAGTMKVARWTFVVTGV